MTRKLVIAALLVWAYSVPMFGLGKLQGWAQKNGTVSVAGFQSTTKVQQSYPLATISVYNSGTVTLSTIYSTATLIAKANPFTAGSDATWFFYAADGDYDVTISDCSPTCGITTPFTYSALRISSTSPSFSVTSYGAVCDGVTDDTAAFQAAANVTGPHQITIPASTCVLTNTITTAQSRVNWLGAGQQSSIIKFQPTSGKPAFDFNAGAQIISQNSISGIGFISTDTTFQKIMVRATAAEEIEIANIASSVGNWTGATSIGVELKGTQNLNLHDCTLAADQPVRFILGPAQFQGEDHPHLWNLYLLASGASNYNITVDSNLQVSNMTVDGYEAWIKGAGGFIYNNNSGSAANNIYIAHVRHEQGQNTAGYIVNIGNAGAQTQSVMLEDIYGGLTSRGIILRNCYFPTIKNFLYIGAGVSLDVDSSDNEFTLMNSNLGTAGASVSITGQKEMAALQTPIDTTSPGKSTVFYRSTSHTDPKITLNGTNMWSASGTLLANGQFNILAQSQTGTEKGFIILVAATNNTTGAPEGGTVIVSKGAGGSAAVAGNTANFGVGNVAGKLTIFWQNSSTVTLFNQLGGAATADYTITVLWN